MKLIKLKLTKPEAHIDQLALIALRLVMSEKKSVLSQTRNDEYHRV